MLLIIEIFLLLIALYRGWTLEALGIFLLYFIEQLLIVEFNIINEQLEIGIEILFILILLTLCANKKIDYSNICKNCNNYLDDSIYSCSKCGTPLVEDVYKEIKTEASYIVRMIMRDKNSFEEIKEILLKQYQDLGLNDVIIDKNNTFMLRNDNNSYILAKKKNFDLTIETFNIEKPNLEYYQNLFIFNKK